MAHEADDWIAKSWLGRQVKQVVATLPESQKYVGRVSVVDDAFHDEKGVLHVHTVDGVWCPAALVVPTGL